MIYSSATVKKTTKATSGLVNLLMLLRTNSRQPFKRKSVSILILTLTMGLLETHDVDASLKEKLKCLVFIPIISQTYCDSKSFAWQQEFCAFNKLAKEDLWGRDIRLAGGNVASRILPIKINDLGGCVNDVTYSQYYVKLSGVNRLSFVSGKFIHNLKFKK